MNIKDKIAQEFKSGRLSKKTEREIFSTLKLSRSEMKVMEKILRSLQDEGVIVHDEHYRYDTPERMGAIIGSVMANKNGFGFLLPDDREKYPDDFFIPAKNMNGAFHGDRVMCIPFRSQRSDDEVKVIRILERKYKELVGTVFRDRNNYFLRADEERFLEDVFIPRGALKGARVNDKVIVKLSYENRRSLEGEVIEILGDGDDFFVEELSLIRGHGLREEFPDKVLKAAHRVPMSVSEEALVGRCDFRDELIVTVDGEDTRDIDDAISVEKQGKYFVLGVHIADVTNYVKYGDALDKEALRRGTSVYFPDRVLPMLPKALSNGICSLNEGVDRLAISCVMTIDKSGNVVKREISRSVIRSKHRMTYHAIEDIFNGKEQAVRSYPDLVEFVHLAYELTDILKKKRQKNGEVELDVKEAKILMDEDGNITIPEYEYLPSQGMIEQFMVLANEQVAEFMTEEKAPFVYRVHEKPKEEKAEGLKNFLLSLGLHPVFDCANVRPSDYRDTLKAVQGTPYASVVSRVMLRSMAKARYSPLNLGHFGLSSKCYCHFTSPIRRYPDLCIHRILKEVLDGKKEQAIEKYSRFVSEAAERSSEAERTAVEAERDVDDLYKAVYCDEHLGEEFLGVVSGVTVSGFFVELSNTVEGFVSVKQFKDSFEYLEERFLLRNGDYTFRIGDGVKIRIAGVDFGNREIDFDFIKKIDENL